MQIDSIELFRVPLGKSQRGSGDANELESIVVAISSGGQTGWGDTTLSRAPCEQAEWSAGAFACLRDWLAPALVGQTLSSGQKLQEALSPFCGNSHSKSALDIAWWNLSANRQEKPLGLLLGAPAGASPISATLDVMDSLSELFAAIGLAFETGYELVTLKFRAGWDLEMVRAVRQTFPAEPIAIDCDGLCTLGQQEMFYRLEDFFLKCIEQPLREDDLVGHAMLQQSIRTPLSLDQSVTSLARVEQIIDLGSCRHVRIDLGRVGGLTPALAIYEVCKSAQIPCGLGAAGQGTLEMLAAQSLSTLPNFQLPAEVDISDQPVWTGEKLPLPTRDSLVQAAVEHTVVS